MGKWIKTVVAEYKKNHGEFGTHGISPQEMAAFIDGRLDPVQREKVIHHLNRCQECSDFLDLALLAQGDEQEASGEKPVWGKLKPFYSLAASILFMVVVGTGIYHYGPWRGASSDEISVTLFMDSGLKGLLMENNNTRWQSQTRIKGLENLLAERGIANSTLKGVVMDKPYVAQKSFFTVDEKIIITITDGVAHIEVKKINP